MALPHIIYRGLRHCSKVLPSVWRLPFITRLDQLHGVEPESRWLKVIGPCRGIALDVGANYGHYSYVLSKLYSKVIAFEPNSSAAACLAAWKCAKVELVHVGLSSQEGEATLYIPVTNGFQMSGWGSLDRDNCSTAVDAVNLTVRLRTLDSFAFKDVGFIKIDVEGHELEVLKGAAETITACKPHLLIEVRQNESSVHELLATWGYESCRLNQLVGVRGSPANVIFRPSLTTVPTPRPTDR